MKRILDCQASDFKSMNREELLAAIGEAEGRTIACETIGSIQPMLGDITNAEFVAAMGADILLLNIFDVQKPYIAALPKTEPENVIHKLRELTGRPIGINLEPVEQVLSSEDPEENMWAMTSGRKATLENAKKAAEMGVNFILLTGNPGIGVTNAAIEQTLRLYKKELGDSIKQEEDVLSYALFPQVAPKFFASRDKAPEPEKPAEPEVRVLYVQDSGN